MSETVQASATMRPVEVPDRCRFALFASSIFMVRCHATTLKCHALRKCLESPMQIQASGLFLPFRDTIFGKLDIVGSPSQKPQRAPLAYGINSNRQAQAS